MTNHEFSRAGDGLLIKRYGSDPGDAPHREWRALQILHEYAPGLAPAPIAVDLDAVTPSITMSELPGKALGGRPLSSAQMTAIEVALDRLHTCVPQSVLADVPMCPRGSGDLVDRLAAQPRPADDAVTARAYDESLRWLSRAEEDSAADVEPVLGLADHNLTNFLWDGKQIRLVDFEYSGRSDLCFEMAEMVEHIAARCTPDDMWQQFLDRLDLTEVEGRRLLTIRRGHAIMWFFILLPGQAGHDRNPPGTLRKQAERTLDLLNA